MARARYELRTLVEWLPTDTSSYTTAAASSNTSANTIRTRTGNTRRGIQNEFAIMHARVSCINNLFIYVAVRIVRGDLSYIVFSRDRETSANYFSRNKNATSFVRPRIRVRVARVAMNECACVHVCISDGPSAVDRSRRSRERRTSRGGKRTDARAQNNHHHNNNNNNNNNTTYCIRPASMATGQFGKRRHPAAAAFSARRRPAQVGFYYFRLARAGRRALYTSWKRNKCLRIGVSSTRGATTWS